MIFWHFQLLSSKVRPSYTPFKHSSTSPGGAKAMDSGEKSRSLPRHECPKRCASCWMPRMAARSRVWALSTAAHKLTKAGWRFSRVSWALLRVLELPGSDPGPDPEMSSDKELNRSWNSSTVPLALLARMASSCFLNKGGACGSVVAFHALEYKKENKEHHAYLW